MGIKIRTVRIDRLDRVVRPTSRLKFIKLDLEGGEFHAMKGGAGLIEEHRPVIVFEHDHRNSPMFYDYQHADLLDFFDGLGYRIFDILGNPFDDRSLWDAAEVWYYVAAPRRSELEEAAVEAISSGA